MDFQLRIGQPLVDDEALAVDDVEGLEVEDDLGKDALVRLDGLSSDQYTSGWGTSRTSWGQLVRKQLFKRTVIKTSWVS